MAVAAADDQWCVERCLADVLARPSLDDPPLYDWIEAAADKRVRCFVLDVLGSALPDRFCELPLPPRWINYQGIRTSTTPVTDRAMASASRRCRSVTGPLMVTTPFVTSTSQLTPSARTRPVTS
ncbi:hypothetical protein EV644_13923 [Kribbella orskensis]|uniref:Uncharacterized protein n=1 Tax=Kribbella orskensis TaxID=2512216 RepID=A0ABY2B7A2_9ACTN|nr:hypothetical protein EV642_14226 [Kribbella sp. VKM Ac-2500]TCO09556.1 hypothetical protein EV644_13923 [Kribbella orskensis]